jgi:ubiquitin thioesterase ZRANB1
MSHDSHSQPKWTCEYCTYENFPNALKCTMCRGAKPLLGEDIYRLCDGSPPPTSTAALARGTTSKNNETNEKWCCDFCSSCNSGKAKECVECRSPRHPVITASNLHEQLRPLRITDQTESLGEKGSSPLKSYKWSCVVCTYENWPKARKCIMCGTSAPPRLSPSHSTNSVKISSPDRDHIPRGNNIEENSINSLKRYLFSYLPLYLVNSNFLPEFL